MDTVRPFFPPNLLEQGEQLARQLRPLPVPIETLGEDAHIGQYVLKVVSPCNLACDYCYEYTGPDQSWRTQPRVMPEAVVTATARRMGQYAARHALSSMHVSFHGGEPLMAGEAFFERSVEMLRDGVSKESPDTHLNFGLQTNGTLLSESMLKVLDRMNVRIGVSLDGSAMQHNKHRLNFAGRGSFDATKAGIERLSSPEYRHLFSGLLCVVDLANDPIEVYDALAGFQPPTIDFLLPYGNHDAPPAGKSTDSQDAPYADWLIPIFEKWCLDPSATKVRLFSSVLRLSLGDRSLTEAIGTLAGGEVVIRADGSYELPDGLKMTYDGAAKTNLTVFDTELNEVAKMMRSKGFLGKKILASECRQCPFNVGDICGGGYIATRYSKKRGLDNPSIYCHDLADLIHRIVHKKNTDLVEGMYSIWLSRQR